MNDKLIKTDFDTFKKILLADDDAQQDYDALEDEFLLIAEMIHARKKAKKTQREVALAMKTTASMISRLESINGQKKHSPTLDTLKKYARAVGCRLSIRFVSEEH